MPYSEEYKVMNWCKIIENRIKYYQEHKDEILKKAREKTAQKKAEFNAFCEGLKEMRRIEAQTNAIIYA
jgi:hypothetical protein